MQGRLYRLTAFTEDPRGGNPAGVWIGETLPEAAAMLSIAADVGYSETAFVAPASGRERSIRFYSPKAEVSFCGHATVAAGVVLGRSEGEGSYRLATAAGEVEVTARRRGERFEASLRSVTPAHETGVDALVDAALPVIGWSRGDLDPAIPPARAFAGAWHLVLAAAGASRLAELDYDMETLESLMLAHGLTTLQLVYRESPALFHSRNPFPVGGVYEDPATGASAAALGGYLRDAGLIDAPATLTIRQGEAMGRPSRLEVEIPKQGGIVVSGTAVDLP